MPPSPASAPDVAPPSLDAALPAPAPVLTLESAPARVVAIAHTPDCAPASVPTSIPAHILAPAPTPAPNLGPAFSPAPTPTPGSLSSRAHCLGEVPCSLLNPSYMHSFSITDQVR